MMYKVIEGNKATMAMKNMWESRPVKTLKERSGFLRRAEAVEPIMR